MSQDTTGHVSPRQLLTTLVQHRRWWITPAVVGFLLAALYAVATPRRWKATQGVLIRPAAAGLTEERLGKFSDLSEMKTLQETILELARSQSVVAATLEEVGPPPSWFTPSQFPTPEDVVDFRDNLLMNPPGGAEFGKTEVFYLGYVDKKAERAAQIVEVLRGELESRLKELRDQRAQSMIAELEEGVLQADAALQQRIDELTAFEARVGDRLIDLRSIESPLGGTSQLSQQVIALEAEVRLIEEARVRYEQLLLALTSAQDDPLQIAAFPASLIASQPALESLKQGLVDAQLTTAQLKATRRDEHPFVVSARQREQHVQRQLHAELAVARRGVELELAHTLARGKALTAQLADARSSMTELADLRAPYSKRLAAVENQTRLVESARKRLGDAQVTQAGAQSASLLAGIDQVESGVRPVGPGRSTIALGGGLAGLLLGLGLTFVMQGPGKSASSTEPTAQAAAYANFEFTSAAGEVSSAPETRVGVATTPVTYVADPYATPVVSA